VLRDKKVVGVFVRFSLRRQELVKAAGFTLPILQISHKGNI
jgi:hypothetical protein